MNKSGRPGTDINGRYWWQNFLNGLNKILLHALLEVNNKLV